MSSVESVDLLGRAAGWFNADNFVIGFALPVLRSAEFLGESDEQSFRPTDVAEPIRIFVPDYLTYELCAALAEPFEGLVDVIYGKHDPKVAESVHRSVAVIRDHGRREETGQFDPSVAVRHTHHCNLDALISQPSDTSSPLSFDRGSPFELEAELAKEINRPSEILDNDSYVVHPLECHVSNLRNFV
jgi:hypothetical protein